MFLKSFTVDNSVLTASNSDPLTGRFHEKYSFCVEVNGCFEKFDNVSVHPFSQTNVDGVLIFIFIIKRLGLKFSS